MTRFKFMSVLVAAAIVPMASAQVVTNSTPDPLSSFEYKLTSDGSSLMALNAWTFHEASFNLPFGLDFKAGHGAWLGTRTSLGSFQDVQGVLGYELYIKKDLGADWFLKAFGGFAIGPRTDTSNAFSGYLGISAGKTVGF